MLCYVGFINDILALPLPTLAGEMAAYGTRFGVQATNSISSSEIQLRSHQRSARGHVAALAVPLRCCGSSGSPHLTAVASTQDIPFGTDF